jgi:hypothetical protein
MTISVLVILYLPINTALQGTGQTIDAGNISGTITFSDGHIAPNVQLMILVNDTNYTGRTMTDGQGHYGIDHVPFGDVVLYPYNSYQLYPLRANMFLEKNPDRLRLTKEHPNATKDLVMASQAGVIFGTVVSIDGLLVSGTQVVLCHSDEVWRSAEIHSDDNGHFRYIVPSGEAISVYTRSGSNRPSQQENIVLNPGETRNMSFVTIAGSEKGVVRFEGEACKPFRP